jgi:hypothetical protein
MAVDDRLVWQAIQRGWRFGIASPSTVGGYLARLHEMWRMILYWRETPEGANDENLAAAEHYAYARFFCAATGDTVCIWLGTRGYEKLKSVAFALGLERKIRTNNVKFPALPPSADSVRWGDKGARDGRADYRKLFPGAKPKTVEALKAIANTGFSIGGQLMSYSP